MSQKIKLFLFSISLLFVSLGLLSFIDQNTTNNQQASIASAQTTIADFSFKQEILTVEEGKSIRITIVAPVNLERTTRVPVRVQSGTARSGTDFRSPTASSLTFYKGGLREKSITIQTIKDSRTEQPETFSLLLGTTGKKATVTISDKVGGGANATSTVSTSAYDAVTCPITDLIRIGASDTESTLIGIMSSQPLELRQSLVLGAGQAGNRGMPENLIPFFPPHDFGGPNNRKEYVALKVHTKIPKLKVKNGNTILPIAKAGETSVVSTTAGLPSAPMMSISKCPGDFRQYLRDTRCMLAGPGEGAVTWNIVFPGENPVTGVCNLEVGKEYYVNYTYAQNLGLCSDAAPGVYAGIRGCKPIGDTRFMGSGTVFNPDTMTFEGFFTAEEYIRHRQETQNPRPTTVQ